MIPILLYLVLLTDISQLKLLLGLNESFQVCLVLFQSLQFVSLAGYFGLTGEDATGVGSDPVAVV